MTRPKRARDERAPSLHTRIAATLVEASELLDRSFDGDDRARISSAIEALGARDTRKGRTAADPRAVTTEQLRQNFHDRVDRQAAARRAAGALRALTSPTEMLARAPAALCAGSRFTRSLLSLVVDGHLMAESVHLPGGPADENVVIDQLQATPVRLEQPLVETELLRRRRAAIVAGVPQNRRVHRETAELMGWDAFVGAPLLFGSRVFGILYAAPEAGEPVDDDDRDALWEFASALSAAYESASLRRTLRNERVQMREFLERLNVRSAMLNDAAISFAGGGLAAASGPAAREPHPEAPGGRDDRLVFADLLTSRELDVLRLLADGHSNRDVADALVLSAGTVKFHVNNILKRLHVANRAEAVARYLSLLGLPSP